MPYYTLKKYTDNSIIFEGFYASIKDCLENAVSNHITLPYVDLKNQNLTNANLDSCSMPFANFCGANLTGANLSESDLNNAIFYNCGLYNTCLSYTNLKNSDFRDASFGATLIEGSNLQGCLFSTLSSFELDFQYAADMLGCEYTTVEGKRCDMSNPPIVIKGLFNVPIIIFDDLIKIGTKTFSKTSLPQISNLLGFNTKKAVA